MLLELLLCLVVGVVVREERFEGVGEGVGSFTTSNERRSNEFVSTELFING